MRSHLRSPLGAYAVNLIREIEVARLCLIDPEAKRAYDAWLELRPEHEVRAVSQPSKSQYLGKPDNIGVELEVSPLDEFPSPAAIGSSIVTHQYGRKKRKNAPIYFVFMWLVSGAIGLLGGYAVLCMIGPQYDFLHLMFAVNHNDSTGTESLANTPVASATTDATRPPGPATETKSTPRRAPSDQAESKDLEEEDSSLVTNRPTPPRVDRREPKESTSKEKENPQPVNELEPLVVPFDLKQRVIRVVSFVDELPAGKVLCDVSGSQELAFEPLIDFPLGGKRDVLFDNRINNVIIGFELTFLKRLHSIVVEIRPKYRLPSGDEQAFYKIAGIRKAKQLSDNVSEARNARQALPGLQNQLNTVMTQYRSAMQTANSATSPNQYAAQLAAQRNATVLFRQGTALQKQVDAAESLVANLPQLEADLTAIQKVGQWGGEIAASATLAVSIHNDRIGLPAEAK